jgi:hypothetical protein
VIPIQISNMNELSDSATLIKPFTVSLTYVRSWTGVSNPRFISGAESAWEIIAGITARSD